MGRRTAYNWCVPWNIRLRDAPKYDGTDIPRVGDAWFAPWLLEDVRHGWYREGLGPKYWALPEPRREPLIVRLPDTTDFCIDTRAWRTVDKPCDHKLADGRLAESPKCPFCAGKNIKRVSEFYGDGWVVTGEIPLITLSPSINIVGSYHGYIQNGIIQEDCEGRKFVGTSPGVGV